MGNAGKGRVLRGKGGDIKGIRGVVVAESRGSRGAMGGVREACRV